MSIGNRIRQVCQQKGFSQEYIAGQIGLTQAGYRKIETDDVKLKVNTLLQLVTLFKVDVNELLYPPQQQLKTISTKPISQPSNESGLALLTDSFAQERQLYKQLLQSHEQLLLCKEEQLMMQQRLLTRYEKDLLVSNPG